VTFLGPDPRCRSVIRRQVHKSVVSTSIQTDRYTFPATLSAIILPSGSTTTKNCFVGPAIAGSPAPSLTMDSLAITDPDKLPNDEWIIKIATAIAATIMDKRIKTILQKLMRSTRPSGCMIRASSKAFAPEII
jgi:hypothetical protein